MTGVRAKNSISSSTVRRRATRAAHLRHERVVVHRPQHASVVRSAENHLGHLTPLLVDLRPRDTEGGQPVRHGISQYHGKAPRVTCGNDHGQARSSADEQQELLPTESQLVAIPITEQRRGHAWRHDRRTLQSREELCVQRRTTIGGATVRQGPPAAQRCHHSVASSEQRESLSDTPAAHVDHRHEALPRRGDARRHARPCDGHGAGRHQYDRKSADDGPRGHRGISGNGAAGNNAS